MKNIRTNGAATAAETTTTTQTDNLPVPQRKRGEGVFAFYKRQDEARQEAAREKLKNTKKVLTIELGALEYGQLVAGALVHSATPEELAAYFIGENICEWVNRDFIIEEA